MPTVPTVSSKSYKDAFLPMQNTRDIKKQAWAVIILFLNCVDNLSAEKKISNVYYVVNF